MIPLLFFLISGVCAPFDWTDCDYSIIIYESSKNSWAKYDPNFKTLIFVGDWKTKTDCYGMSWWKHEWLHAEIGPYHYENSECLIRSEFHYKFEHSWMVGNAFNYPNL